MAIFSIKKIDDLERQVQNLIKTTGDDLMQVSNKKAYMKALDKIDNLLLGVELHVRNYKECKPYHCHIIFNSYLFPIKITSINF